MDWELLAPLNPDERRAVLASARRRKFARNEVIFHEGDPGDSMHLIATGRVAVRVTTPLGENAILVVLGAGSFFGEMAIVAPAPRNATVAALEPTETMSLHRDHLKQLRAEHPAVDRMMIDALVAEVRRLSHQLLEALYVPVEKRVYRRLSDLTDIYSGGDAPVRIPMTQEDLAQLAGTTRPTTNKILKTAEADGIVAVARGRIEVLDLDGLARRAR